MSAPKSLPTSPKAKKTRPFKENEVNPVLQDSFNKPDEDNDQDSSITPLATSQIEVQVLSNNTQNSNNNSADSPIKSNKDEKVINKNVLSIISQSDRNGKQKSITSPVIIIILIMTIYNYYYH